LHYQSKDRIYRKGQKNACTYYYLVADKTVDGEILQALEHKANAAEAVFNYLKGRW
jgi:SNF2 family DNA or RNA helicase